jgi:hypothetical protein
MRQLLTCVCFAFIVGCGGGSTPPGGTGGNGGMDMAMPTMIGPDMAFASACGHPGDKGNSKGVGKFCETNDDCSGLEAGLCSTINNKDGGTDPNTFFCVKAFCNPSAPATDITDFCGENATCLKNALGAACVPVQCAPPSGAM